VVAEETAFRQAQRLGRLDDHHHGLAGFRDEAIRRAFWEDHIVAGLIAEHAIVRFESAAALVNEVEFVAVAVAEKMGHRPRASRQHDAGIPAPHDGKGCGVRGAKIRGREVGAGKGSRAQRPLDPNPAGRGMQPVKMRGRAAESTTPMFFFVDTVRNADVGLIRRFSFFHEEHGGSLPMEA
jgi:hypothetical protein